MTSLQIQKALAPKVTQKILGHAMARYNTMTEKQRTARVYKMTKPVKLEAFRQVAKMAGDRKLAALAREKRDFMFN